ncbi:MAG TPA: PP2C family protein-serine/threonine phosphatase, partial [Tepidisphaeraceae bacterium]|nr:PP2C family protein-serine/threonine phosphatase [Tepidisphaeraceae bacterium]
RYETDRANDEISLAINRYLRHLDEHYQQVNRVVQVMLGDPTMRSLLAATDDSGDASAAEQLRAAKTQLKEEVFGRDVQAELTTVAGPPAFHVLINFAHDVVLVALPRHLATTTTAPAGDEQLERALASRAVHWPVDAVIDAKPRPVMQYIATPGGLFLAMGIPLREELSQPPTHAYFAGFRIDDDWIRQQMLAQQASGASSVAPLSAWFVLDNDIVARASSDPNDKRVAAFTAATAMSRAAETTPTTGSSVVHVAFNLAGEHFVGQSFDLNPQDARTGRLVLASSLDRALGPLHYLQRSILLVTGVTIVLAMIACEALALMISRPINQLVAGTKRIAAGQFDLPVNVRRRDELGTLADSFNEMSQGLKQRDGLLEERVKIQRDMAVARKIQMDVLPKQLPVCRGYDMAAYSLPAEQTGGDIYDLVAVALDSEKASDNASLVLLLADATGHGIGPALSVTQVRAMLRIGVRLHAQLDEVFAQMNRQLCQDLGSERFVTAFLGLLDPNNHSINYQSAGQGPLLHFHSRTREMEWLVPSMLPLGIDEDPVSEGSRQMELEPGDLIVLLTDGFYEFQNPERELFGRDRVAKIIMENHQLTARELMEELISATREFARGAPQLDDMTCVIIRRLNAEVA